MAATEVTLHLALPIVFGIILGILEAFFVYEDENMTSGKDFLGDMWHGLIFAVLGVAIASNVPYLTLNFIPSNFASYLMIDSEGLSPIISGLISLIMLFKMVASHAIKGVSGGGFTEKFWHKLVISLAVGFSPYFIFSLYNIDFLVNIAKAIPWLPL